MNIKQLLKFLALKDKTILEKRKLMNKWIRDNSIIENDIDSYIFAVVHKNYGLIPQSGLESILSHIDEKDLKYYILLEWLKISHNNIIKSCDLYKLVDKNLPDKEKSRIFQEWMKKSCNNPSFLTIKNFFLDQIKDNHQKLKIINLWIEKKVANANIDKCIDIANEISDIKIIDNAIDYVVKIWNRKTDGEILLNDLYKMLPIIKDEDIKSSLVEIYSRQEEYKINIQDLKKMTSYLNDEDRKSSIIIDWYRKIPTNFKYQVAQELIKENIIDIYNLDLLSRFLWSISNPLNIKTVFDFDVLRTMIIKDISDNFYNNDYVREQFYLDLISKGVITNSKEFLSSGFDKVKTDDLYLNILDKAKHKKIINNIELLDYLKGRQSTKFKSLEVLNDLDLESIFIEDGKNIVKSWIKDNTSIFSDNNNSTKYFNISNYKLTDIINYASFNDKLTELQSILKPEFLKQLRDIYKPSSNRIFTKNDINKISQLLGIEKKVIENKFINTGDIAILFQPLFANIPQATEGNIKNLQCDDKIKDIILKSLNKTDLDDNDIKYFFKYITEQEISNQENISKLSDFIAGNTDILSYIFSKDNSLEKLSKIIYSINDGCVANITNQLNNIVILFIIDDMIENDNNIDINKQISLKTLYKAFIDNIVPAITRNSGDVLGADNSSSIIKSYKADNKKDVFNNNYLTTELLNNYILQKVDYDDYKIIPDKILNKIWELDGDKINIETKKAIAESVIINTIGEKYNITHKADITRKSILDRKPNNVINNQDCKPFNYINYITKQ